MYFITPPSCLAACLFHIVLNYKPHHQKREMSFTPRIKESTKLSNPPPNVRELVAKRISGPPVNKWVTLHFAFEVV